jgi:predicted 3-demethylubiquinone-9 3-methyltransferase (glyoxalase superfamily)
VQKITPFLWFNDNAEEAMNFYVSIFKSSKAGSVSRYGEGGPGPKGSAMSATFELEGLEFFALNGGPQFPFTEAVSFFVNCETQEEVDELWEKLSAGGKKGRCGWLKDKLVCPGRSFPRFSADCCETRILRNRRGSCRP